MKTMTLEAKKQAMLSNIINWHEHAKNEDHWYGLPDVNLIRQITIGGEYTADGQKKFSATRWIDEDTCTKTLKEFFSDPISLDSIAYWMKDAQEGERESFDLPMNEVIGIGFTANPAHDWKRGPLAIDQALIVLERKEDSDLGFQMVTAFPFLRVEYCFYINEK